MEREIDDRIRAEALLAGEKRLLEMVARGRPLTDVLEALCRFVESTTPDCCCSVLLVDPAVRTSSSAPHPVCRLVSLRRSLAYPSPRVGSLRDGGESESASDCVRHPVRNPVGVVRVELGGPQAWHARVLVDADLVSTRKVLGSFAILYREPGTPTPLHQTLIERFTNIASVAIERARSDAALKRSEAFLAEAQRLSSTGSFSWRVPTDKIVLSDEAYRIHGIEPGTPVTFELIRSRVHPDNLPMLQQIIDRFRREAGDLDYETRLLMPTGRSSICMSSPTVPATRRVNWRSLAPFNDVTQRRLSDEACGRLRSELAHMARATTLGALTASIAHEVNQPLAGIITNASTCLRMLGADPPNIDGPAKPHGALFAMAAARRM